jgi:GNAT superfamily N-acetyltransferase
VKKEPITLLSEYARIPIAFTVDRVFDVRDDSSGGFLLAERMLELPYRKDYDAINGEGPTQWARRYDISNWALFAAYEDRHRIGGATVAFRTPDLTMLEDRRDLAVLWDIRVAPGARGKGVGYALFEAAETWTKLQGCRQLKVETQNINVGACRFYERQGCVLREARRNAYPELPDEIQLLWYKSFNRLISDPQRA